MHGHQGDLVVVILVGADIDVAEQRDVLDIVVQGEQGHSGPRLLQLVGIHGLLLPLLDEGRRGIEELVEIRDAGETLDGCVGLVGCIQTALVSYADCHVVGVGHGYLRREPRYHVAERLHLGRLLCRAVERYALPSGGLLDGVHGDSAYAPGRLVHDPAE